MDSYIGKINNFSVNVTCDFYAEEPHKIHPNSDVQHVSVYKKHDNKQVGKAILDRTNQDDIQVVEFEGNFSFLLSDSTGVVHRDNVNGSLKI